MLMAEPFGVRTPLINFENPQCLQCRQKDCQMHDAGGVGMQGIFILKVFILTVNL